MGLTKHEEIIERIITGFDQDYYDGLYRQMRYAFGHKWDAGNQPGITQYDEIPIYSDIPSRDIEVGESRRLMNAAYIVNSRHMSRDIRPDFPQIPVIEAEVRKQFFKSEADAQEWWDHISATFTSGVQLGQGGTLIGARTDPHSKLQRTAVMDIPSIRIVWDAMTANPVFSPWVAVIHYLTPGQAAAMHNISYGEAQNLATERFDSRKTRRPVKIVRVIEYWDMTSDTGDTPTYATILGKIQLKNIKKRANPFPSLPVAFFVNFIPSGQQRPVGLIKMQASTAEQINAIERAMKKHFERGQSLDLLDVTMIDENDLRKWSAGEDIRFLKMNGALDKTPWTRIAAEELSQTSLGYLQHLERQYTTDSNLSEGDRNISSGGRKSATEIRDLSNRINMNAAWVPRQALRYAQRLVTKVMEVARVADLHPRMLDIYGQNIMINDPEVFESRLEHFLEEPSVTIIGSESMTPEEDRLKRSERQSQLMEYLQMGLVGVPGGINQEWFMQELVRAGGNDDPKVALAPPKEGFAMPPQGDANAMAAQPA